MQQPQCNRVNFASLIFVVKRLFVKDSQLTCGKKVETSCFLSTMQTYDATILQDHNICFPTKRLNPVSRSLIIL